MGKYRVLGSLLDRVFRNNINQNFDDIDVDIKKVDTRVSNIITENPQPSEVVDSRGGFPVLRDRLDTVDAHLAENAKKIESHFVNVAEFGAVGDYYLADGTVNPNPTDNTTAIQNAFNASKKVKFGDGAYYCLNQINLPQNAIVKGNKTSIVFENFGFNLGNYTWNIPEIYDLTIRNKDSKRTGKGIFSDSGYIVYPKFHNLDIAGFESGMYFKAINDNSNCTWGDFYNIRIEYCTYGFYFTGGWMNTIKFRNIWLNYIDKNAFRIVDCPQLHNFVIDKLTMEFSASDELSYSSPFYVSNSYNGEITIYDSYIERNGWFKTATTDEATNYKTNGSPIVGWFYDSKSWELNGKIYSEDTNRITHKDLQGSSTFRFDNCRNDLKVNLKNTFLNTDLLGIASFSNTNVGGSNPEINIDVLHLVTYGFSFPNMRYVFTNTTPSIAVKVLMSKVSNVGGGSNFKYGDSSISVIGDLLGGIKTSNDYAVFKIFPNTTISANTTLNVTYNSKYEGSLNVTLDSADKSKMIIPETGLYMISASFVFGIGAGTHDNDIVASFYKAFDNRIGCTINKVVNGRLNELNGLMLLTAKDVLQFKIQNTSTTSGIDLVGANNNVNYLIIKKIN